MNYNNRNSSNNMGDVVMNNVGGILGQILFIAVSLPIKYYVTFLWILLLILVGKNNTLVLLWFILVVASFAWKPLSKKFNFYYWEPMDNFLPILSDVRRRGDIDSRIQRQMEARGVFIAAGIIDAEDEQTILPAQFDNINGGYSLIVDKPVTRSLSNDIELLTSTAVADYMGVKYVYPYINGDGYVLDFVVDGEKEMIEGNQLLRQSGLVKDKDARFYLVELVENDNESNFYIFDKYISNSAPVEVAEKIGKNYLTRFNALYTETFPTYDILDNVFIADFAEKWDIDEQQVANGTILRFVTNLDNDVKEANNLLHQMGVLRDGQFVDAILINNEEEDRLILRENIVGRNINAIANTAEAYKGILGARAVRVIKDDDGNDIIRFIKKNRLDEPRIVEYTPDRMPDFNVDKMSVVCAVDEFGEKQSISFKDNSGMVIGGMPGSGKTAGATSFLLPVAMSEDVDLTIIDCKGGADWDSYRQVADTFIAGADTADELEYIAEIFQQAEAEMIRRVGCQKELLGQSNFWNATVEQRRKAKLPFKLIVVDECQDLFEKKPDKELNAILPVILSSATKLIKRGRSAGIFVMFMTQKPTQDSLPTGIRDNCGLSIAFRLKSPYAVGAVLGPEAAADLGTASPLNIPMTRKGGAVIMTDTGEFKEVRFFYTPEQNQDLLLSSSIKAEKIKIKKDVLPEPDPTILQVKKVDLPVSPPNDNIEDDLLNVNNSQNNDIKKDVDNLVIDDLQYRKNTEIKEEVVAPKRKPGRPRKNPQPETNVDKNNIKEKVDQPKSLNEPEGGVETPQKQVESNQPINNSEKDLNDNKGVLKGDFINNSKTVDELFEELMKNL